jgi:hypothetical protein
MPFLGSSRCIYDAPCQFHMYTTPLAHMRATTMQRSTQTRVRPKRLMHNRMWARGIRPQPQPPTGAPLSILLRIIAVCSHTLQVLWLLWCWFLLCAPTIDAVMPYCFSSVCSRARLLPNLKHQTDAHLAAAGMRASRGSVAWPCTSCCCFCCCICSIKTTHRIPTFTWKGLCAEAKTQQQQCKGQTA